MEIRQAHTGDIPGLLRLLLQVEQVHHHIRPDIFAPGGQKYDAAALEKLLRAPDMPVFAAISEGKMVGYCFCQVRLYDSAMFCPRKELYIDDLCVDEVCRGQGVGKALYAHAVGYAKKCRCNFIGLNVWCGNDSALGFYENLGLKPRSIMMDMALEEY